MERKVTGKQGTSSLADTVDSGVTSLSLSFPHKMCTKPQVHLRLSFRFSKLQLNFIKEAGGGFWAVGGDYGILCVCRSLHHLKMSTDTAFDLGVTNHAVEGVSCWAVFFVSCQGLLNSQA